MPVLTLLVTGIAMAASLVALTAGAVPALELDAVVSSDTFEDAEARRPGAPEIVSADISPGLLRKTRQGVYRADGLTDIVPKAPLAMPDGGLGKYLTSSVRIYSFGRERRRDGQLAMVFASGDDRFRVGIRHLAKQSELTCVAEDGQKMSVPYQALPVDFSFAASTKGDWSLTVTSLADSSVRAIEGTNAFFKTAARGLTRCVSLMSVGREEAEVTVDNVLLAISRLARKDGADYAFRAAEEPEFDAARAGWKPMFGDEFDGTAYDESKWSVPERLRSLCSVSNGIARVLCDYKPGTTNLTTGYISSQESFGYGYYEARVKFTTYNGWWSALFLYSQEVKNPFLDGMEIDIYEDYYMRNPERNVLDHNLHANGAGPLKSWNYTTKIPGSHTDWYTIGCKWTPFEITYYLDGKIMKSKSSHSPYGSVTFDAFRHATTIMPLKIMFGGRPFTVAYGKHPEDPAEVMPEAMEVDWIRAYRWPGSEEGASPVVTLRNASRGLYSVPAGETVKFVADVRPSRKTGSGIKAVHLFDGGYHLMTKCEPPYEFAFPLSDDFYRTTAWKRSGRAKENHPFDCSYHAFAAFAEDESGGIGHTDAYVVMLAPEKRSEPYRGVAQTIPGKIDIGAYDEGGQGVAYSDTTPQNRFADGGWRANEAVDANRHCIGAIDTGEWINYTVDVAREGNYEFDFLVGTPYDLVHRINVVLDGRIVGTVSFGRHEWDDWRTATHVKTRISLPAGRHVVTLHLFGHFNLGDISVAEVD